MFNRSTRLQAVQWCECCGCDEKVSFHRGEDVQAHWGRDAMKAVASDDGDYVDEWRKKGLNYLVEMLLRESIVKAVVRGWLRIAIWRDFVAVDRESCLLSRMWQLVKQQITKSAELMVDASIAKLSTILKVVLIEEVAFQLTWLVVGSIMMRLQC